MKKPIEPPAVRPKVAPREKAIQRTDAELDDMTSADAMEKLANEAADDWRENAPENYATLLDPRKQRR